jgi:hypothetical protein
MHNAFAQEVRVRVVSFFNRENLKMACNQEQRVRELAYQIWEQAGYPCSNGVEFWLQAESELAPVQCKTEPKTVRTAAKVSASGKKK